MMAVSFNWFGTSTRDLTQETDRAIHLVRTSGMLVFEAVKYPLDVDERNVVLRNVATVDLCVVRLELIRANGSIGGQFPPPPQRWLRCGGAGGFDPIPPRDSLTIAGTQLPSCPDCFFAERVKLRVWYIARNMYNQDNPEFSADEMQFVETLILYPGLISPEACVPPEGAPAVFLASVDPLTRAADPPGEIPSARHDKLYVSLRHADPLTSTPQTFTFTITGSDSSGSITGNLRVDTSSEQPVGGPLPSIRAPFRVIASSGSYTVIPNEFYFGAYNDPMAGLVHVSGIGLITQHVSWIGDYPIVTTVVVELAKQNFDVGVTVPVRIRLIDCKGNVLAETSRSVNVPAGVEFDRFFIDLPSSPPILAFKVYTVEVLVG